MHATVTVENTGSRDGSEVVQVYAGPSVDSSADQAVTKLIGFAKVEVAAGASRTVTIAIDPHQFEYWDTAAQAWRFAAGARSLTVGTSATDSAARLSVELVDPATIAGDKTALQAAVTGASSLDPAGYVAGTWAAFASALTVAQQVLDDATATLDQVQDATLALATAQAALRADTTSLQLLTTLAAGLKPADYTSDSWAPVASAQAAAQAVLADTNPGVADVSSATDALKDALAGLQPVKTAALRSVLSGLDKAGLGDSSAAGTYTTASWRVFQQALAQARAVLADSNASQAQVDTAVADLLGATANLVRADTCPVAIKLNQTQLTLVRRTSLTLKAGVYYASGTGLYQDAVTWRSSNPKVATVDRNGRVTGLKAGTVTITATADSTSADGRTLAASITARIVATRPSARATKVTATVPRTLEVGTIVHITGTYSSAKAAGEKVYYSSSDYRVAQIDSVGRLIAKNAGTATITIKAGGAVKTYKVTVS